MSDGGVCRTAPATPGLSKRKETRQNKKKKMEMRKMRKWGTENT